MCTAMPICEKLSPFPAIVVMPSIKSVSISGIGSGFQRSWFGVVTTSSKGDVLNNALTDVRASAYGRNGLCKTDRLMRCVDVRLFDSRGGAHAVPENCSA